MADVANPFAGSNAAPAPSADAGSASPDFGALLDGAAQDNGGPLAHNPAAFASFYGPAADKVSARTGIDSNTILGQWGLETGWGKSVIPGTNNLGNIKSTKASGPGVSAKDNQTGSNDSYQKFDSPDSFADAYSNLLNSRYSGALNTGSNALATGAALKAAGYAEDPKYAQKIADAAKQVTQARSGGPDFGAMLDGALGVSSANAATPNGQQAPAENSIDATLAKYKGAKPSSSGNPIVALGAGLGRGLQQTALGAQALVGKGLQAVGADSAGQALVNDAQQGNAQGQKDYQAAAGDSMVGKAGQIAGSIAPALLVGPEVLPQAALGAGYTASDAALENKPILPSLVEGGALGAGGAVGGKLLSAGAKALEPAVTKLKDAFTGGEGQATRGIANALGDTLDPTIANLNANSAEIIPGSLPTAAEAANNPIVAKIQRGLQNTSEGQTAFPARQGANMEARLNAGDAVVGPDLASEQEAFTNLQSARIAKGQSELPPLSQAQSDIMQTPEYQRAISAAKQDANSAGVTTFDDATDAAHANVANNLDGFAGTQADLDAAYATRKANAEQNYGQITGDIPLTGPAAQDLVARDAFAPAVNQAASNDSTRLGLAAPDGITNVKPQVEAIPTKAKVEPVYGPNGVVADWREVQPAGTTFRQTAPGYQAASAQTLVGAKSILGKAALDAGKAGDFAKSGQIRSTLDALDSFLSEHSPAYRAANDAYASDSIPIARMQALQSRLIGAVDPISGQVSPTKLKTALVSLEKEQFKPGLRNADRVSQADMDRLGQLSQDAAKATRTVAGVNGQGQEMIRQGLEQQATNQTSMAGQRAAQARDSFNSYLGANSPSYGAYFRAADTTGQDLEQRAVLNDALDRMRQASNTATGDPQVTLNAARSAMNKIDPNSAAGDYAKNLFADLQRASTANASLGAAGSQTAANLNLGGGLIGTLTGHGVLAGAAGGGHIVGAAIGAIAKKANAAATAKTEKAAIDLLLNPKKLAKALEEYKNQPSAKQAFVQGLKQRASGAGTVGLRAVQAFEANQ